MICTKCHHAMYEYLGAPVQSNFEEYNGIEVEIISGWSCPMCGEWKDIDAKVVCPKPKIFDNEKCRLPPKERSSKLRARVEALYDRIDAFRKQKISWEHIMTALDIQMSLASVVNHYNKIKWERWDERKALKAA